MKTDALIAFLARGDAGVAPGAVARRLLATVAAALALAPILVIATIGPRPDLAAAAHLPMFWAKLAVPLAVGALAFAAVERLARPGERAAGAAVLAAALLAMLWGAAAADVAAAPAALRPALILGGSALSCVVLIALLSLPVLAVLLATMRTLAPTRLAAAGAAAGALAGGIGASAYTLHCTEMALPFLATWYVLGMAIPATLGALVAPRWLRWS